MRGARIAVAVWALEVLTLGCAGAETTGAGGGGLGGAPRQAATPAASSTAGGSGQETGRQATPTTTPPSTTTGAGSAQPAAGGEEAARAAAVAFMRSLVDMVDPVAHRVEVTGGGDARVTVRPRAAGEQGAPAGEPTSVQLHRSRQAWVVTGTRAPNIVVEQPARGALVRSPLRLTGRASAFEGTVQVEVIEERGGKQVLLGSGFVTGSGSGELGPFEGTVNFQRPATRQGWIAFSTVSEASAQVLEATTVRVRFG